MADEQRSWEKAGLALGRLVFLTVVSAGLLLLTSCGPKPPTAQEIRDAYARHVRADPVHEVGLKARQAPIVIPQQEPVCTPDGNAHFDCRIRVIFETDAGPKSEEQRVHIRREGGSWVMDSVN